MGEIIINSPFLRGRKLSSEVSVSHDLEKYLKEKRLDIEYDAEITTKESILNVPLTATVLPLAWLTGSNIVVEKLDRRFKVSMDQLKLVLQKMFPRIAFSGEIIADELVDNQVEVSDTEKRFGLLFSGGIDSTYSLITNLDKNPSLIMFWGLDNFPFPERSDHWNETIETYSGFARKKNLDIFIIKTNISQIIDYRRIEHRYHKELYDGSLRMALHHSLLILPPLAPLAMGRFDHVIIAASLHPLHDYGMWPFAANPEADEKIVWADTVVQHDGYIMRHEKFKAIADYLKKEDLILRVCTRSKLVDGYLNDSVCEKCLITIINLIHVGIDPNKYGFKVDESSFELIRNMWGKKNAGMFSSHWWELQAILPEKVELDMYGSKAFFEWFRDYKFDETEINWFFTDLYNSLPYDVARLLDKLFRKLDINVHPLPWVRKKENIQ